MALNDHLCQFLNLVATIKEGPSTPAAIEARKPLLTAWDNLCKYIRLKTAKENEAALLAAVQERDILLCAWPQQSLSEMILSSMILASDRLHPYGCYFESERSRLLLCLAASLGDLAAQQAFNSALEFDSPTRFPVSTKSLTIDTAKQLLSKDQFDVNHLANTLYHYSLIHREFGDREAYVGLLTAAFDTNANIQAERELARAYLELPETTQIRLKQSSDAYVQAAVALAQIHLVRKLKPRRRLVTEALAAATKVNKESIGRLLLGELYYNIAENMSTLGVANKDKVYATAALLGCSQCFHPGELKSVDTIKEALRLGWVPTALEYLVNRGLCVPKSDLLSMLDPWSHASQFANLIGWDAADKLSSELLDGLVQIAKQQLVSTNSTMTLWRDQRTQRECDR